jgi:hypothetical protein
MGISNCRQWVILVVVGRDNPHEVARWLAENPQLALMLRDHYVAGSDEATAEADEKAAKFTSRPDGRS